MTRDQLEAFFGGYVAAAQWQGGYAADVDSFDADALAKMRHDCEDFCRANAAAVAFDPAAVGDAFWTVRQGYLSFVTCGWWAPDVAARLDASARAYGPCELYDHDDLLYVRRL